MYDGIKFLGEIVSLFKAEVNNVNFSFTSVSSYVS